MKDGKKVVVLSGLIGSGKSTLLEELQLCGAGVILMDDLWKLEIYQECHRQKLTSTFGEDVLNQDGSPNKALLRTLLFSLNKEEQKKCQKRIDDLFEAFADVFLEALCGEIDAYLSLPDVTMVVVEGANIFAHGWHKKISSDMTVVLHCDKEIRLQRVTIRNPEISRETYLAIMEMQISDDQLFGYGLEVNAIQITTECSLEGMRDTARSLYGELIKG